MRYLNKVTKPKYIMNRFNVLKTFYFSALILIFPVVPGCEPLERAKREFPLIFYRDISSVSFICGFGIPVDDLEFETVTSGVVFRSTHSLPSFMNNTISKKVQKRNLPADDNFQMITNDYRDEELLDNLDIKRNFTNFINTKMFSRFRWEFYKMLEHAAENLGFAGRDCVLKSICEAAEFPFHLENGIIEEIIHIIFTPSSSVEDDKEHGHKDYIYAEQIGLSGQDCNIVFPLCSNSLMSYFSKINHFK